MKMTSLSFLILPDYLANDPLGLFLLLSFSCVILALLILWLASIILP